MNRYYLVKFTYKNKDDQIVALKAGELCENSPAIGDHVTVKGKGAGRKKKGIVLDVGANTLELLSRVGRNKNSDKFVKQTPKDSTTTSSSDDDNNDDQNYGNDESDNGEAAINQKKVLKRKSSKGGSTSKVKEVVQKKSKKADTLSSASSQSKSKQDKKNNGSKKSNKPFEEETSNLELDPAKKKQKLNRKGPEDEEETDDDDNEVSKELLKNRYKELENKVKDMESLLLKKYKEKEQNSVDEPNVDDLKEKDSPSDSNSDEETDAAKQKEEEQLTKYHMQRNGKIPIGVVRLVEHGKLLILSSKKRKLLNSKNSLTSITSQVMRECYKEGPKMNDFTARGRKGKNKKKPLPHTDEIIEFCRVIERKRVFEKAKDEGNVADEDEKDFEVKDAIKESVFVTAINLTIRELAGKAGD